MNIELALYGTRGSMACASREYMEFGGDTSSYVLRCGDKVHFLDGGSGVRRAFAKELDDSLQAAYLHLTHGHPDHIEGLGAAGASYFNQVPGGIRMMGSWQTRESLTKIFDGKDLWPVSLDFFGGLDREGYMQVEGGQVAELEHMTIKTLTNYHPPVGFGGSIGYRFDMPKEDGSIVSVVYTTDMEFEYTPGGKPQEHADEMKAAYVDFVRGADVLLADTQFTNEEYNGHLSHVRGWGHPTVEQVLDLAGKAGVKHVVGTHHHTDHVDSQMHEIEKYALDVAPSYGVEKFCFAREGMRIKL